MTRYFRWKSGKNFENKYFFKRIAKHNLQSVFNYVPLMQQQMSSAILLTDRQNWIFSYVVILLYSLQLRIETHPNAYQPIAYKVMNDVNVNNKIIKIFPFKHRREAAWYVFLAATSSSFTNPLAPHCIYKANTYIFQLLEATVERS